MATSRQGSVSEYGLCPLYSFECECESTDLVGGIKIERAPSELGKHIHERTKYLYGRWEDPSKVDWAVFIPYRTPDVIGLSLEQRMSAALAEWDTVEDSLVDLVTAFRLLHSGRVLAGPVFSATVDGSSWSLGGHTRWTRVSEKNFILEDPMYSLSAEDVAELRCLFEGLHSYRDKDVLGKMDLTMSRFHSSYTGPIEDRIIDQMIAFESLYLSNEQELTYKLAMRVAFLLGSEPEERLVILSDMKKAYRYRSSIIHGDEPPNRVELGDIVPKTEDYLRQSIRAFLPLLAEGKSLKQLRETLLDENIVRDGDLLSGP